LGLIDLDGFDAATKLLLVIEFVRSSSGHSGARPADDTAIS
jgi:hypothetical protein